MSNAVRVKLGHASGEIGEVYVSPHNDALGPYLIYEKNRALARVRIQFGYQNTPKCLTTKEVVQQAASMGWPATFNSGFAVPSGFGFQITTKVELVAAPAVFDDGRCVTDISFVERFSS